MKNFFKKDKVAASMLQHTMEPIHYPLTRELTPEAVKEAVKQFKNIMGHSLG